MRQKKTHSMGAAALVLLLFAAFWMQWKQELKSGSDPVNEAAQQYIKQALPSVNRGGGSRQKQQSDEESAQEASDSILMAAVKGLTNLSFPVVAANSRAVAAEEGRAGEEPLQTAEVTADGQTPKDETSAEIKEESAAGGGKEETKTETAAETAESEAQVPVKDSVKKPAVLIYHTHATESYQPVSVGNFHSVDKEGTVRQVGDVLAQRLEELGYRVIHDETVHDNPSYNQSYSRSLETAKNYLSQYPDLALVIDLHRDAAGYAGGVGKTVSVEGKNAATYGYVIGQGNPNVAQLTQTVNDLNRVAKELYPDFTGRIIEKAYKFNQYISDHHVLIEVGNNENTIEQSKLTGRYLADVIAAYLKERGV